VDVIFDTSGEDSLAPSVTGLSPADGASGVATDSEVAASFSEPIDQGSLVLELRDGAGALVSGTVSYDPATQTATLVPSALLEESVVYSAEVSAADLSGNTMSAPVIWSFTTVGPPSCPCSVWSDSDVPSAASAADTNAIEVGVKFRTSVDGYITGVRFYKGALNTGTHVGSVWTSSGALLANVTFVSESATGWQQALFASPVPVSAGTTYIVSYHAPNGGYAFTTEYFQSTGVVSGPLEMLVSGADGPNGLYRYGANAFPTNSWRQANYWVDVIFDTQ
jgi:hypothetical protein